MGIITLQHLIPIGLYGLQNVDSLDLVRRVEGLLQLITKTKRIQLEVKIQEGTNIFYSTALRNLLDNTTLNRDTAKSLIKEILAEVTSKSIQLTPKVYFDLQRYAAANQLPFLVVRSQRMLQWDVINDSYV